MFYLLAIYFLFFCSYFPPFLLLSDEDADWAVLKPNVFATVMDFFNGNLPVMLEAPEPSANSADTSCKGKKKKKCSKKKSSGRMFAW